ncbi:MAG: hypothetical protein EBV09_05510 [Actinobacteria bacterium]|nr:hypothetical protein [Actinomycetota bacterium]
MWSAPYRASKPISGAITIPGSKSVTNRALVLSALASSPSTLRKGLRSRDTDLMIKALSSLGVTIKIEEDLWKITPAPLMGPASIDVGNAGTVMRFLPPLASLAKGLISFDGDPRSHQRPLGPVITASLKVQLIRARREIDLKRWHLFQPLHHLYSLRHL